LMRQLVDPVEVGPLLAIDLDIDKPGVHSPGDLRVVERLVCHDMAPMAGRVSNRQQDRAVRRTSLVQRRTIPWLPVYRLFGMLLQVGAE